MPSWLVGLVAVVVISIASVLAYTKELPWGDAYEIKAVFSSAQSVRPDSPVRIAGVNVGEVTKIESLTSAENEDLEAQVGGDTPPATADEAPGQEAAVVTMELTEDARLSVWEQRQLGASRPVSAPIEPWATWLSGDHAAAAEQWDRLGCTRTRPSSSAHASSSRATISSTSSRAARTRPRPTMATRSRSTRPPTRSNSIRF